mgnify:CR=1 FL=1|jgi:hypothetical protein
MELTSSEIQDLIERASEKTKATLYHVEEKDGIESLVRTFIDISTRSAVTAILEYEKLKEQKNSQSHKHC